MSTVQFAPNERVLCYHGPLVYEAKVLKADNWDETNTQSGVVGPHYFVHYKGWKQTWDEWVPSARLLKYNDTNVALQKQLVASTKEAQSVAAATAKTQKTTGTTSGRISTAGGRKEGTRGTKRGREEDDGSRKLEMKLTIPNVLKVLLVDDWENITKKQQLVSLPRYPTVEVLLQEFATYVLSQEKPPQKADILLPVVTSGLKLYFDRALGTNLLYRFERPQYRQQREKYVTGAHVIVAQTKEMSQVYGAEHLLRMIVSLPAMVAQSKMDQESVLILREYVHELLNFMVQERHRIFLKEYETASSHYQNIIGRT
ncbi:MRG-domain-containing protein [Phellopilus nigrolimitatus]|nr:MRG-domain-containing protein [Phellopilus nigrolimitatus]